MISKFQRRNVKLSLARVRREAVGGMKNLVALAFLSVLGCSGQFAESKGSIAQSSEDGLPPPLIAVSPRNSHEGQTEKNDRIAADYQVRLADAPVYKSEFRDELVKRTRPGERYRYLPMGIESLARIPPLPPEFRCTRDPKVINAIEADGWQLVHCTGSSLQFFKRRSNKIVKPKSCDVLITDDFDVLRVLFKGAITPLPIREYNKADHMEAVGYYWFGNKKYESKIPALKMKFGVPDDPTLNANINFTLNGLALNVLSDSAPRAYDFSYVTNGCSFSSNVYVRVNGIVFKYYRDGATFPEFRDAASKIETTLGAI